MPQHALITCLGLAACLLAGACANRAPPCPYPEEPEGAPSAGCFVATDAGLLVVEHPGGQISLPGGAVEAGEPGRCAAVRETWEETGARAAALELLQVFDSGFHLYACSLWDEDATLQTRMPQEISAVYFLPRQAFGEANWRFPGDRPIFERLYDAERQQGQAPD